MPKAWGFCCVGFGIQEKAFCCAEGFFYVCNLVVNLTKDELHLVK
ncbi:Uncharacterised protein [Yersinia frederiksenii]|nr:Uncharacterised protein [Yersinia frederiksenii]